MAEKEEPVLLDSTVHYRGALGLEERQFLCVFERGLKVNVLQFYI